MKLIGTKSQYIMSYASIALVSCILIGLVFFRISVNELNEAATREQINKLELATEYLENQQKLMMEIAYKIQNTIYYKPSQLEVNKYKDIILLKDFVLYKNYIPVSQEYFLLYHDSNSVYGPSTTNTFQHYMQHIVNITDYQGIYDKLNSVSEFTVICPVENENVFLLAFPIYLTEKMNLVGDATLCFVVQKANVLKRIKETIGTFNGDIHIYYDNLLIISSNTLELLKPSNVSQTSSKSNETKYIKLNSYSSNFTLALKVPEFGIYDRLGKYVTFSKALIIAITAIMIIFAALVAYYSYRPIKRLVNQYEPFFNMELKNKNEITQISLMLNSAFEKSMLTSNKLAEEMTRLENQRKIILRQFIQLLLSGEIDENISESMRYLDIPFACPYYNTFVIQVDPEKAYKMDHLMTTIENLSDDTMILYAVKFKHLYSFSVLTIISEKTQTKKIKGFIEAIGEVEKINLKISVGLICDDIKRIQESIMDAIFKQRCDDFPQQFGQRDIANSFLYNDSYLHQMTVGLENGDSIETINIFEQFIRDVKDSPLSPIIQHCIFSDVVSMLIRVSSNYRISIPQEIIGTLMFLKDADSFLAETTKLIIDICTRIRFNIEEKEKSARLEIVEYINNNCGDYNMDLLFLSDKFNLSGKQISRIINEITGMPYKEYLTYVRINLARKMLVEHDLSVAEISRHVGFMNTSYFIGVFRKTTGLTPAIYKKRYSIVTASSN
ncbi:MAG TPA: helix-turn-helix domain-containing protein [Clostridiales bacterium]|nr:helix-turn-helix domain-containing protein [Clostridiales bacterium]